MNENHIETEEISVERKRKEKNGKRSSKKGLISKEKKRKKSSKNRLIVTQLVAFSGVSKTVAKSY